MTPTTVQVTAAGQLYVDGEHLLPPPGVDTATAITRHLQLQAVDVGAPVQATIHDEHNGRIRTLQVAPDGTATEQPAAVAQPDTAPNLPAPQREALDGACAAATTGDLTTATVLADDLLAQLSSSLQPDDPSLLHVAQVRADIAWLSGDVSYAFNAWLWIAAAWTTHLPSGSRTVGVATRNAVAAWRHLPGEQAIAAGPSLRQLLEEVAPQPETNPTVLGVQAHLTALAASTTGSTG